MPNYLIKCCEVVIVCLILMMVASVMCLSLDNKPTRKFSIAKRSFLSRERDYLRDRPISNDLKSFIKRSRRRTPKFDWEKNKREEKDKDDSSDHMYIVKSGNIVPLENLKDVTLGLDIPESDPSGLGGNFTVIPLVIPITVKTFTNATFCDYDVSQTQADEYRRPFSAESSTRYEDDKMGRAEKVENKESGDLSKEISKSDTMEDEKHAPVREASETTEVLIDDALSTMKADNMKFLNRVLTDVQDLISYEKEGKSSGNFEGAMCAVIGDWDSNAGGMQLQITVRNESLRSPNVGIVEQEPPAEGFLKTGKWNFSTEMPYNHSSLVVLTAVSEKTVATFIGDCRICDGAETITGSWMLGRRSSSCNDRHETHSFLSDVMRKSNIRRLQKAHLDELSIRNLTTTTEL